MRLSNIFGADAKERLKKILYKVKNRDFKPYVVDRVLYGTEFKFYVANKDGEDWYEPALDKNGEWIWPEMKFMKDHICKNGDVVIECGAHHGLTAVVASKWVGAEGHIYCFEPNPENLAILHKNLGLNGVTNVTVIPKAVGSAAGTIKISNSSSNSHVLKGKEHVGVDVDVVRIDDYAYVNPVAIKIDVEGFETDVLKGAADILKSKPKLMIELHPDMIERYGSTMDELLSLIDKSYKVWVQWDIYKAPEPYDRLRPISDRAHLFAVPK